jgi:hypothetical protein
MTGIAASQLAGHDIHERDRDRLQLRDPNALTKGATAGAYSECMDTSQLLPQYKGIGIVCGAGDASPAVRTTWPMAGTPSVS